VTALASAGSPIITTRALRKTFRTRRGKHIVAVEGLDLDVHAGGVHGFLGPNGSGKTTTIRLLLGLMHADSGDMSLFGQPVPARLGDVIGRIGAIVEQPRLFPRLSGKENLELLAGSVGIDKSRIGEVLELVGLAGREDDNFRSYSLGMRQRLAIAAALLKSPELLILDEPTNGLDPAGIREIRDLMRDLADEGLTILVSSHILSELEQVVDSVTIIARGRLLASGTLAEITGNSVATVRVRVDDATRAAGILTAAGLTVSPDADGLVVGGAADPATVTKALADVGLYVRELTPLGGDLESVFLDITGTRPAADTAAHARPEVQQ
jgi:ABC-type multidrug transport system ATPase subunit